MICVQTEWRERLIDWELAFDIVVTTRVHVPTLRRDARFPLTRE